jgi:hypothetical protein
MTLITSFTTYIVVNFLDGRELISKPIEGISPFWDISSTFGVNAKSFFSEEDFTPAEDTCTPAGMHIHMLTGAKGSETVLGSKILLFSDLYNPEVVASLMSGSSNQTNSVEKEADLKSTFIKLDMNMGLQLDIINGENLVPSKQSSASSFLDLFSDKECDEVLFDPRVEVRCIRHDEDPSNNTYKKYT